MHGILGEDGRIQSLLEWLDIPYVGSGPNASSLCLDKDTCKRMAASFGWETIPSVSIRVDEIDAGVHPAFLADVIARFGPSCVVKPVDCGSSIGVSIANSVDSLLLAIGKARRATRTAVLVEEFVHSMDVDCLLYTSDAADE